MPSEEVSSQSLDFSMHVPQDMYRKVMFYIHITVTRERQGRLGYGV